MSKAEERAMEAYPEQDMFRTSNHYQCERRKEKRRVYREGYRQAEKDLALTWEDIQRIVTIADLLMTKERMQDEFNKQFISPEAYYTEVLNRFNKARR